jgi:succinyl-CoA synthetase alpha subunit
MVGEIGGSDEEAGAPTSSNVNVTKPVVGVHRRCHRAAGQTHGARGCGDRRWQGHGGRQIPRARSSGCAHREIAGRSRLGDGRATAQALETRAERA